ncbi:hypothetical protein C8R44DRAFT_811969 [Mycena epipterygia]|nr:hypothetical protein C8R44DRAFT_811969 [Mycena epipterygia]
MLYSRALHLGLLSLRAVCVCLHVDPQAVRASLLAFPKSVAVECDFLWRHFLHVSRVSIALPTIESSSCPGPTATARHCVSFSSWKERSRCVFCSRSYHTY